MLAKKIFKLHIILFLFALLGTSFFPFNATADITAQDKVLQSLPQDIFPISKTNVLLAHKNIFLDWSETTTTVKGYYHFVNPDEEKIKVKMGLCLQPFQSNEDVPNLKIIQQEKEIETTYSKKLQGYTWNIEFEPNEEVDLEIQYTIHNTSTDDNTEYTGFLFNTTKTSPASWNDPALNVVVTLDFNETHPGQILNIYPNNYDIIENSLVWKWDSKDTIENLIITSNISEEINSWQALLSATEKESLLQMTSQEQFSEVASFLEKKYTKTTNSNEKQLLQLGTAYYMNKAGNIKDAFSLYSDLVDHETPYSRPYWEIGKTYEQRTNKTLDLIEQIRELHIHSLLQSWLFAKLPLDKITHFPPEIKVDAYISKKEKGVLLKSNLTDKDGDIKNISLLYHWKDEPENEIIFEVNPFLYEYSPSQFITAPGDFKQLYYELRVTDCTGHEETSGEREFFYLNENIQSETFILNGANLVLGDYTPKEQSKVYKWFISYLKMAKEAGFVPVETKNPLIVFLGQPHDFIKEYQETLSIKYTPAPFSPDITKIGIHRFYLSNFYGDGWKTLSEKELVSFGDALMYGKGWHAKTFKCLKAKDQKLFFNLLSQIGQGKSWNEALMISYHLTPFKLFLLTIWHIIGNTVCAFVIIIIFALLAKHGLITRLIKFLRESN